MPRVSPRPAPLCLAALALAVTLVPGSARANAGPGVQTSTVAEATHDAPPLVDAQPAASAPPALVTDALGLRLTLEPRLEQRVRHQLMSPLSLSDRTAPELAYFDQRLRAGLGLGLGDKVRVVVLADVLNDVAFGDNGSFTGVPQKNRGSVVATRQPNLTKLGVGRLSAAGGALDRNNYGLVFVEAPPVELRHLYGEIMLPFGLLRAGRMPLGFGRSVLVHDGTRINRWGVSGRGDYADGVAFGTKLSAIADAAMGRPIDIDPTRGLFAAFLAGQMTTNLGTVAGDALVQLVGTVWYEQRDLALGPVGLQRLRAGLIYATRGQEKFDTRVHTLTGYLEATSGPVRFTWHHAQMFGGTREISEGLALLGTSSGPAARQDLRAFGGLAELAVRLCSALELSFEVFYASGDDDPRSTTPLTQLTFAEDTNVGLHLVKNVIGYQTARSAALGVENLRAVSPPTMAVNEIDTRGAFQNGVALFPQVIVDPLPWLSLRAGALFMFAASPVVDPIGTILRADGNRIDDDAVNFAGGKPASYWGTELDLGLTVRPVPHAQLDLEGAYLLPGDALRDENGDAVRSLFVTTRATLFWD